MPAARCGRTDGGSCDDHVPEGPSAHTEGDDRRADEFGALLASVGASRERRRRHGQPGPAVLVGRPRQERRDGVARASDVRARRADRHDPVRDRRTQRGDVRAGVHRLLGHLLRRTGGPARSRAGRGRRRPLLQLRSRRGGSSHPEGVADHDTGSGDRCPPDRLRERAAADPRRTRRGSVARARCRTADEGGDRRAGRRAADVRRTAHAPGPRRARRPSVPRGLAAARAPW